VVLTAFDGDCEMVARFQDGEEEPVLIGFLPLTTFNSMAFPILHQRDMIPLKVIDGDAV
jgi:hypothetical protein